MKTLRQLRLQVAVLVPASNHDVIQDFLFLTVLSRLDCQELNSQKV